MLDAIAHFFSPQASLLVLPVIVCVIHYRFLMELCVCVRVCVAEQSLVALAVGKL